MVEPQVEDVEDVVLEMARNFVWWKKPEEAASNVSEVLCRALRYGSWDDIQRLESVVGREAFREALMHASPGILDEASWNYWHFRFKLQPVPPTPKRIL